MNRIKDLRLASGMSQAQLGQRLGCHGTTVSKFELETRQLDPALICDLCDIFGCTADYLLCRSDTPWPTVTPEQSALIRAYDAAIPEIRQAVDGLLAPYLAQDNKKETA